MNRFTPFLAILLVPMVLQAAEATWPMDPMEPSLDDTPSLQRGLRLYANY